MEKDGRLIPLSTVARIETGGGLGSVRRKDLKRMITVEGNVEGRSSDSVLGEIQVALASLRLPAGYQITYAGENEEQQDAAEFLTRAFIVGILAIALVLITQFNSLFLPITVLSSVILSMIGVLIGLMVTRLPFGIIMTGIGVISLAGSREQCHCVD